MANRSRAVVRTLKRAREMAALGILLTGMLGCAEFHAARLYRQGTASLNAGNTELAIMRLERAGDLSPRVSEIQNHLGLALAKAGQHDKATAAFQRAVDLDCSNAAAAHNLVVAGAAARDRQALARTEATGEP